MCTACFCWAFADFGDSFEVFDVNGEEPKELFISSVTKVKNIRQERKKQIKYMFFLYIYRFWHSRVSASTQLSKCIPIPNEIRRNFGNLEILYGEHYDLREGGQKKTWPRFLIIDKGYLQGEVKGAKLYMIICFL